MDVDKRAGGVAGPKHHVAALVVSSDRLQLQLAVGNASFERGFHGSDA